MLGLDEVVTVNVGAAPTPPEVIEFFHAIGIELAELWGMSETCGAGSCNRPGAVRIGSVGQATPGVELRLADDGELLVRGACVMRGYRNRPQQTAEALGAGRLAEHRRRYSDSDSRIHRQANGRLAPGTRPAVKGAPRHQERL